MRDGEIIVELYESLGLTRKEFASRLNISLGYLAHVISDDDTYPLTDKLKRQMIATFSLDPDYFEVKKHVYVPEDILLDVVFHYTATKRLTKYQDRLVTHLRNTLKCDNLTETQYGIYEAVVASIMARCEILCASVKSEIRQPIDLEGGEVHDYDAIAREIVDDAHDSFTRIISGGLEALTRYEISKNSSGNK